MQGLALFLSDRQEGSKKGRLRPPDSVVRFYRKAALSVAAAPLAIFQPVSGDSGPLERLSVLWILYTEGKAPRAAAGPPPGAHFSRPPPLLYDLLRKIPPASVFSG